MPLNFLEAVKRWSVVDEGSVCLSKILVVKIIPYIFFPHYCLILARTLFEGKTGQKLNQHLHSLRQIFF